MNYNTFINKDFRKRHISENKTHPRLRWGLFLTGCIAIGAVIAHTPDSEPENDIKAELIELHSDEPTQNRIAFQRLHQPLALPENPLAPVEISETENKFKHWDNVKVQSGDSLSSIFERNDISPSQVVELMSIKTAKTHLVKIHPGENLKIDHDYNGTLLGLYYDLDFDKSLLVERVDNRLESTIIQHDIAVRPKHVTGTITESLFLGAREAGLTDNMTMELAAIFGWDIDFVLDIRKGDSFSLIYEEIYKNGNKVKDGNILAAEFINQGKSYRAVRYEDPKTKTVAYYTEDGKNLRKAFLRSPVKFSYISSKFTNRRYHPVLHKYRSHKGIDYAARRGTPVRSSGEGKVIFRGKKGGYGNVVIIKHGSRYSTLYAHLSKFNRKIRTGRYVKQGQVIGYVGSTGLATGPHLHYEFRVNGVHRNPLTVRFPSAKSISKQHLASFKHDTYQLFTQLDVLNRNQLALNQ